MIFFDGEESFKRWTPTDSLYGERRQEGRGGDAEGWAAGIRKRENRPRLSFVGCNTWSRGEDLARRRREGERDYYHKQKGEGTWAGTDRLLACGGRGCCERGEDRRPGATSQAAREGTAFKTITFPSLSARLAAAHARQACLSFRRSLSCTSSPRLFRPSGTLRGSLPPRLPPRDEYAEIISTPSIPTLSQTSL
eukprot:760267-Hanusia_phi.AAC.11